MSSKETPPKERCRGQSMFLVLVIYFSEANFASCESSDFSLTKVVATNFNLVLGDDWKEPVRVEMRIDVSDCDSSAQYKRDP